MGSHIKVSLKLTFFFFHYYYISHFFLCWHYMQIFQIRFHNSNNLRFILIYLGVGACAVCKLSKFCLNTAIMGIILGFASWKFFCSDCSYFQYFFTSWQIQKWKLNEKNLFFLHLQLKIVAQAIKFRDYLRKYFDSNMNIAKNLTRDDNKFRQSHDLNKYLLYI